jgi:acetolactate synthase-1/2/3 large subunit
VALAEALAIPVFENASAKCANFPKSHPLYQGAAFRPHKDEIDLALLVRSKAPWYPPSDGPKNATVVAIDENPLDERMVYQSLLANVYLEGDVPSSLRRLADAAASGADAAAIGARGARWQAAHDRATEAHRKAEAEARTKSPIDPAWLCARLSAVMPDNAIYVDETTTHRAAVQDHLMWNAPHDYIKVPTGLGQGLGAALGVKLACPDRPVVSIIGDGGFLYNPVTQCLGLSMEASLPILIVVFNNTGYNAMRANHLSYYPDGTAKQNDLYLGHTINGPDYAELIGPFGGFGRKVEDPAELDDALREGLAAVQEGRTAILNVVLCR